MVNNVTMRRGYNGWRRDQTKKHPDAVLILSALPGVLMVLSQVLLIIIILPQTTATAGWSAAPCNKFSVHTKVNEDYCLQADDKGGVYILKCSVDVHQLWEVLEFDNFTDLEGLKAKMFKHIATGRYLRHTQYSDWNQVDTYPRTSDHTMWVTTNDEEGSYCFNIRTYLSGNLYLDVDHATPQAGGLRLYNRLILFQSTGGDNQKFVFKPLCNRIH